MQHCARIKSIPDSQHIQDYGFLDVTSSFPLKCWCLIYQPTWQQMQWDHNLDTSHCENRNLTF